MRALEGPARGSGGRVPGRVSGRVVSGSGSESMLGPLLFGCGLFVAATVAWVTQQLPLFAGAFAVVLVVSRFLVPKRRALGAWVDPDAEPARRPALAVWPAREAVVTDAWVQDLPREALGMAAFGLGSLGLVSKDAIEFGMAIERTRMRGQTLGVPEDVIAAGIAGALDAASRTDLPYTEQLEALVRRWALAVGGPDGRE